MGRSRARWRSRVKAKKGAGAALTGLVAEHGQTRMNTLCSHVCTAASEQK